MTTVYISNDLSSAEIDAIRQTKATLAIEELQINEDGISELEKLVKGDMSREEFQQKLKEKKQPAYSLYLTSALRTEESQKRLRKGNKNATRDTTSHLYGASFDISYWEFLRNSNRRAYSYKHIQNILTKTVSEMRNENKFLVIKENGQFCFHITVVQ